MNRRQILKLIMASPLAVLFARFIPAAKPDVIHISGYNIGPDRDIVSHQFTETPGPWIGPDTKISSIRAEIKRHPMWYAPTPDSDVARIRFNGGNVD